MPTYHYRAYGVAGDLLEGEIEAATSEAAEDALFKQGLTPFETREKKGSLFSRLARVSFGKKGPNPAQIASFTRELATLEEADVPLDQSLRILAAQGAAPALRDLAQEILRRIVDGASLSDALSHHPQAFSPEFLNVVREGEAVGKVGSSLAQLADMLERRLELRARMQSALIYPALLITLAIISTGVVLGTLVPSIAPIFADNGKDMPPGLRFIIDLEAHGKSIGVLLGALVAGIALFYRMAQTRAPWRMAIDHFYLRLPVVGPLLAQAATARFSRTLGSMLNAGVPLLQALESARAAVANQFINHALVGVIEAVRGGANLSAALAQVPYLEASTPQMIAIGEETGHLGDMLLRIATILERQTQRAIERAMGLLTPALTIGIAAVVGGLIMTVMDAVLSINELALK